MKTIISIIIALVLTSCGPSIILPESQTPKASLLVHEYNSYPAHDFHVLRNASLKLLKGNRAVLCPIEPGIELRVQSGSINTDDLNTPSCVEFYLIEYRETPERHSVLIHKRIEFTTTGAPDYERYDKYYTQEFYVEDGTFYQSQYYSVSFKFSYDTKYYLPYWDLESSVRYRNGSLEKEIIKALCTKERIRMVRQHLALYELIENSGYYNLEVIDYPQ